MSSNIVPKKTCSKCGVEFPATLEYFHKHNTGKYGLNPTCKGCVSAHRSATFVNDDNHKQRGKAWRQANPEKSRAYTAKWRKKNPDYRIPDATEKIKLGMRKWRAENPEKARIADQRSKARKRALPFTLTEDDWQRALEYFNHCCAVCGRPLNGLWHEAHADHWIPMSHPDCPGTVPTNIIPLCGQLDGCNQHKGFSDAQEWLTRTYGKRKAGEILNRINEYFAWVVSHS